MIKLINKNPESIQYNAWLALSGTIRQMSKDEIYQEISFESLQHRRWYRRICSFYKILKLENLYYLFRIIPEGNLYYLAAAQFLSYIAIALLSKLFFPSIIEEWNKHDRNLTIAESYGIIRNFF